MFRHLVAHESWRSLVEGCQEGADCGRLGCRGLRYGVQGLRVRFRL